MAKKPHKGKFYDTLKKLKEDGFSESRPVGGRASAHRPSDIVRQKLIPVIVGFETTRPKPDKEEHNRVTKVYVKPRGYQQAFNILAGQKLLFIRGVADVGKTAMAHFLFEELLVSGKVEDFLWFDHPQIDILSLTGVRNSIIIFNDIFGRDRPDTSAANGFESILQLREDENYVILTTREDILNEIRKKSSRFEALYMSKVRPIEFHLDPKTSYTNEGLEEILDKHINYYYERNHITIQEVELANEYRTKILDSLRLPLQYNELVRNHLRRVSFGEIGMDEAITISKQLSVAVQNWLENRLDQTEKYLVITVALFPGLPIAEFERTYEEFMEAIEKQNLILKDVESVRKSLAYVRKQGNFDFVHPDCFEGIWKVIEEKYIEEMGNYIPYLLKCMHHPDKRMQANFSLVRIGKRFPEMVLEKIEKLVRGEDLYESHMAAYVIGEIGKDRPTAVDSIIKEILTSKKPDIRRNAIFVLKKIGVVDPIYVRQFLEDVFDEVTDVNLLCSIISMLSDVEGNLTTEILTLLEDLTSHINPLVKKAAENTRQRIEERRIAKIKMISEVEKFPLGMKNFVQNPSFSERLTSWYSTGGSLACKAVKDTAGRSHCLMCIEERKDNLGRVYQDLTPFLSIGKLTPGKKYELSAFLRTKDVEADESFRKGVVVGVSYVDEDGWTPQIREFQCEVGNLISTQEWTYDSRSFILDPMPFDCVFLWIYVDFNVAKGKAWVDDISLTEVL